MIDSGNSFIDALPLLPSLILIVIVYSPICRLLLYLTWWSWHLAYPFCQSIPLSKSISNVITKPHSSVWSLSIAWKSTNSYFQVALRKHHLMFNNYCWLFLGIFFPFAVVQCVAFPTKWPSNLLQRLQLAEGGWWRGQIKLSRAEKVKVHACMNCLITSLPRLSVGVLERMAAKWVKWHSLAVRAPNSFLKGERVNERPLATFPIGERWIVFRARSLGCHLICALTRHALTDTGTAATDNLGDLLAFPVPVVAPGALSLAPLIEPIIVIMSLSPQAQQWRSLLTRDSPIANTRRAKGQRSSLHGADCTGDRRRERERETPQFTVHCIFRRRRARIYTQCTKCQWTRQGERHKGAQRNASGASTWNYVNGRGGGHLAPCGTLATSWTNKRAHQGTI